MAADARTWPAVTVSPGTTLTLATRYEELPPAPEPLPELLVVDDVTNAGRDPNASPYWVATLTLPVATAVFATVPTAAVALRYWEVAVAADPFPMTAKTVAPTPTASRAMMAVRAVPRFTRTR